MEQLFNDIEQQIVLSKSQKKLIQSRFVSKKIKKKHYLLQEGDIMQSLLYVTNGCLRSYSIDEEGNEHILQFAPAGWWIGDINSLLFNRAATLMIDAVEESTILSIQNNHLLDLYNEIPLLNKYFRLLAERSLATYQQRLIDTLSLPAIERYKNFCTRYPTLITQLPQKYVASYIGVTPEFLSKILNQQPARTT